MIISFFGHSKIYYEDEEIIKNKILEILQNELRGFTDIRFYIGGYGDFNRLALNCCREFKKLRPSATTYYILPYLDKEHTEQNKFWLENTDDSIYPPLEKVPKRYAIIERNKWIIYNSDLVILYLNYPASNTSKLAELIVKSKKRYINLGSYNG